MQPLLKWTGGKRRLAEYIAGHMGQLKPGGRHIELFAGSAALFFYMEPKHAVLVDICAPLIAFYEAIKRDPQTFCDELDRLLELPHSEESYYQVRDRWNGADFGVKFAAELIYLNKLCFNGLFRLNANRRFNVPWGKKVVRPKFPSRDEVLRASELLQNATLYTGDFSHVLRSTHENDSIFLDPPYYKMYDKYAGGSFSDEDHKRLAEGAYHAALRGANVYASNIDCEFIRSLYSNWATIEIVQLRHQVGAKENRRKTVDELFMYAKAPFKDPRQLDLI